MAVEGRAVEGRGEQGRAGEGSVGAAGRPATHVWVLPGAQPSRARCLVLGCTHGGVVAAVDRCVQGTFPVGVPRLYLSPLLEQEAHHRDTGCPGRLHGEGRMGAEAGTKHRADRARAPGHAPTHPHLLSIFWHIECAGTWLPLAAPEPPALCSALSGSPLEFTSARSVRRVRTCSTMYDERRAQASLSLSADHIHVGLAGGDVQRHHLHVVLAIEHLARARRMEV